MAIKSKKTFSGDHDQLAPPSPLTGSLIPRSPLTGSLIHPGAMTDSMRETWEQDTNTLRGMERDEQGNIPEGPIDPKQAGYHDNIVRYSNSLKNAEDIEKAPTEDVRAVFAGSWMRPMSGSSPTSPSYMDPHWSSPAGYGSVPAPGDYRAGGLTEVGWEQTRRNLTYSPEAARAYRDGVQKADDIRWNEKRNK